MRSHTSRLQRPTLFRRGVSDRSVREAVSCIQAYIDRRLGDTVSERQWWISFSGYFQRQAAPLSDSQVIALEIATDSLLTHAGMQSWSVARAALSVPLTVADGQDR